MVEIILACVIPVIIFAATKVHDRRHPPVLGSLGTPAAPPVSRPRRTSLQRLIVAIGPLMMLAGLLVIVWPQAASDCHGSPVCALDAFAELGKLMVGAVLGLVGLSWLVIAGAATSGHGRRVNDSTRPVE